MKKTKLTKKELLLKIFQLQKEVQEKIKYLNYGGCGTFAKMFYEELVKFYPKEKVRIIFFDNYQPIREKKEIIREIKSNNDPFYTYSLAPAHCMVEIDKTLLVDGYYTHHKIKDEYRWERMYRGYVTIEDLEICLEHGSWNDEYNTDQNSKLKRIIKKYFREEKSKKVCKSRK